MERAGDRGYYSALALSPDGSDLYLVYNAFTTPLLNDTTTPRGLVGVVLHAEVGAGGAPLNWTQVHRGAVGDPRGSSQNNQVLEFLGDYLYAATNDYGVAVWNDTRNAADCPAIDAWRASVQAAGSPMPTPSRRTTARPPSATATSSQARSPTPHPDRPHHPTSEEGAATAAPSCGRAHELPAALLGSASPTVPLLPPRPADGAPAGRTLQSTSATQIDPAATSAPCAIRTAAGV